jgi:hypothetical protein
MNAVLKTFLLSGIVLILLLTDTEFLCGLKGLSLFEIQNTTVGIRGIPVIMSRLNFEEVEPRTHPLIFVATDAGYAYVFLWNVRDPIYSGYLGDTVLSATPFVDETVSEHAILVETGNSIATYKENLDHIRTLYHKNKPSRHSQMILPLRGWHDSPLSNVLLSQGREIYSIRSTGITHVATLSEQPVNLLWQPAFLSAHLNPFFLSLTAKGIHCFDESFHLIWKAPGIFARESSRLVKYLFSTGRIAPNDTFSLYVLNTYFEIENHRPRSLLWKFSLEDISIRNHHDFSPSELVIDEIPAFFSLHPPAICTNRELITGSKEGFIYYLNSQLEISDRHRLKDTGYFRTISATDKGLYFCTNHGLKRVNNESRYDFRYGCYLVSPILLIAELNNDPPEYEDICLAGREASISTGESKSRLVLYKNITADRIEECEKALNEIEKNVERGIPLEKAIFDLDVLQYDYQLIGSAHLRPIAALKHRLEAHSNSAFPLFGQMVIIALVLLAGSSFILRLRYHLPYFVCVSALIPERYLHKKLNKSLLRNLEDGFIHEMKKKAGALTKILADIKRGESGREYQQYYNELIDQVEQLFARYSPYLVILSRDPFMMISIARKVRAGKSFRRCIAGNNVVDVKIDAVSASLNELYNVVIKDIGKKVDDQKRWFHESLDNAVSEVGIEHRTDIMLAGIFLKTNIPQESFKIYREDFQVWQSIFTNIIRNSVEAIAAHPDPIRDDENVISIELVEGSCIAITISDTGMGMNEETLDNFYKKGFTEGKTGGTGFGITEDTIDFINKWGSLDVTSLKGEGTTIKIVIDHL